MQIVTKWGTALIMMLMLFSNPLAENWAQAADGDSDGSGGGQNNPLTIESSSPANGAAGVTGLEYIKIVFTKNIAYMTVRDSNIKCFSLWADGQKIPAEIIIADDQIEREKRNDVLVKPLQALKTGTTYRVEIAPELQSKSGVTLGQKTVITFTIAGGSQRAPTSAPVAGTKPDEVADTKITINPEAGVTINSEADSSPTAAGAEQDTADRGTKSNNLWWIALGAAAVILAGGFYNRSRPK